MKTEGWDTVILSDPSHEHLIAEVSFDGELVAQLDREEGRDAVCISLIRTPNRPDMRVRLEEFMQTLRSAAEDLAR
jgi:hypothetical protein